MHVTDNAPARIYMWTSQRLAETTQQAQLYCRSSGSPPPTVTWYDPDEREIRPDDKQHKVGAFDCLHCYFARGSGGEVL